MANYTVNYDDERFNQVEQEKQSELDKYNQMTIVTKDKRMNNKLQNLNAKDSNEIYNKLFNIYPYK